MNKKTFYSLLIALCMLLQLPFSFAQNNNSSQFRGPERSGVYPSSGLANILPNTGPKLLWKKDIGAGFSEIVVEDNKIYTLVANQKDSLSGTEQLVAMDAANGKLIWASDIDSLFFDEFGNGARSTPVYDEANIYCLSSYGKLTACDKKKGKILWQIDFIKEYGSTLPRWGFSTSPLIEDGILIVEVGGKGKQAFMGFEPKTGKQLWAKGIGEASYCSPIAATIEGKRQIIFANRTMLHSYSPTGDSLWTIPISMNGPMAMPVLFDGNKIFISTVRSKGFCVVEVNNGTAKEILQQKTMRNDYSSCVYLDGYLYGFNIAALTCISATTGEVKWVKRGLGKGTVILVDGKLLALSDKGKLVQIKASPDAYKEQGSYQAIAGKSWTAPTYCNSKLYIRNLNEMVCYQL